MNVYKDDFSLDYLRRVLSYDQETGHFTRMVKTGPVTKVGSIAGTVDWQGYRRIRVASKRQVPAHRLAWFYVHGAWPEHPIDHINGNRDDNRLCNLRLTDAKQNAQNRTRVRRISKIGLLGVSRCGSGKYQASFFADGKSRYLGVFLTAEEAHQAYLAAKRAHHDWYPR